MPYKKKRRPFLVLHILEFLVSVGIAFPTYVLSSYLSGFVKESSIGAFYALGAVLTFIVLALAPRMFRTSGIFSVAVVAAFLVVLSLFEFAFPVNVWTVLAAYLTYSVSVGLLFLAIDLFYESRSVNRETGAVRGAVFALSNLAFFVVPLALSFLITDGNYFVAFVAGLTVMILSTGVLLSLRGYRDRRHVRTSLWKTVGHVMRKKELATTFLVGFLLKFSSALIMIYVPIYLHNHLGFAWTDIGRILAFMLVPSILLNVPLGKLSDSLLGEKELIALGFAVLGLATVSLTFLDSRPVVWAAALFVLRSGAGIIEVMTDTHFFKRISASDADVLSLFRNSNQVAYLVVAVISSGLLFLFPMRSLFLILGVLIFAFGVPVALSIRDTR